MIGAPEPKCLMTCALARGQGDSHSPGCPIGSMEAAARTAGEMLLFMDEARRRYMAALEDVLGCAWADPEIRWVAQKALMPTADLGPRPKPEPVPTDRGQS